MDDGVRSRHAGGVLAVCIGIALMVLGPGVSLDVQAATVYSYTDERGNSVYTDDLQRVPEKYRAKVQRFEQVSESQSVGGKAKDFFSRLLSLRLNLSGLSEDQTTVLNYAGGAAIVLLLLMYLCKNSPMIRLLALGLLIVLGIGTPVLIYSGQGGALTVMKNKADEAAQLNDKRLKQVSPQ